MHRHNHFTGHCGHTRAHHPGFGRGGRPPFGHPHLGGHLGRARRGDIRAAVLRLLSEQPMHGYQIIQELSVRSEGAWSPSPGSVYPTLQLLADEGLIVAEETGGKKVFSLTEAGSAAVADTAEEPAPWEAAAGSDSGVGALRTAAGQLMHAVFQVGKAGSAEQVTTAVEVLNDARKKLYTLLAED